MYNDEIIKLAILQWNTGKTLQEINENLDLTIFSVQCLINYKIKSHKKKMGPKCKVTNKLLTRIKRFIDKSNTDSHKVMPRKIITYYSIPLKERAIQYCF